MAQNKQGDVLLFLSDVGLRLYIAVTGLVAVVIAVAMVVVLVAPPSDIAAQIAAAPSITLPILVVSAAVVSAILILGILFALQLLRIIATVKNGDPFQPENADRLTRMGWYALGATVGSWVVGGLAAWLTQHFEGLEFRVAPSGGLALVFTLFILARVFRRGAQMRDDLMGTV